MLLIELYFNVHFSSISLIYRLCVVIVKFCKVDVLGCGFDFVMIFVCVFRVI